MYTLSQLFSTAYTPWDAVEIIPLSEPILNCPWAKLVKCKVAKSSRLPPVFFRYKISFTVPLFWHILNNNLFNIISSRFKGKVEATPPPPWEKENKAKAGCQRKGSVCVTAEGSWQRRKWRGGCVSVYSICVNELMRVILWFESRHLSKTQNGRHKQRSGQHTLLRQKIYKKKVSSVAQQSNHEGKKKTWPPFFPFPLGPWSPAFKEDMASTPLWYSLGLPATKEELSSPPLRFSFGLQLLKKTCPLLLFDSLWSPLLDLHSILFGILFSCTSVRFSLVSSY